ncbi:hypothetical protein D9758_010854 [Tetrapyrgos nigripes]|uniref:Uncharacterized protein n=1 Tax=Tetrapyrgos nigripes TaxID=182062 RepID=A0A8H5GI78_9AGAR|nr:hypothetical protein D9758_010854 [Tetrapyrgos nigripes]
MPVARWLRVEEDFGSGVAVDAGAGGCSSGSYHLSSNHNNGGKSEGTSVKGEEWSERVFCNVFKDFGTFSYRRYVTANASRSTVTSYSHRHPSTYTNSFITTHWLPIPYYRREQGVRECLTRIGFMCLDKIDRNGPARLDILGVRLDGCTMYLAGLFGSVTPVFLSCWSLV